MLFYYPDYLNIILSRIKEKEWLIHTFEIKDLDIIYNPSNYLSNNYDGISYTIKIDLNIFKYIVNAFKKDKIAENHKDAICFIIFCQLANINIEPQYAIYEKIKHSHQDHHLEEILSDLAIFQKINNTHPDILIRSLNNISPKSEIDQDHKINKEKLKENLTKYNRLKEWDSMYLIILYLTYCHYQTSLSNFEKVQHFLELLVKEFRLCFVAYIFALIFFGKKPIKKMMKYKKTESLDKRSSAIVNMTWDLYFMNMFFRDYQNKKENQELLDASSDNALKKTLETAI